MTSDKKEYHELIKELRDERVDVEKVYIGDFKPEKDTIEEVIEEVIVLEDPYVPQRFRDEDKEEIAAEIYEIADSTLIGHLMDTAEEPIPVLTMKKDLTPHKEVTVNEKFKDTFTGFTMPELAGEETADIVEHIHMGQLIGMLGRNWKELKKLTNTEIRNAMINIYSDKDPVVVEAAVDTALHLIRAEEKAA